MKSIFNIILLALFCTSFAQAQGGKPFEFTYKGQTLQYEVVNGNEAMVSKQQSERISGDVKIPERVKFEGKKYRVTTIENNAFWYCSGLTSVTIPNSVTKIGDAAFSDCTGLINVTIPKSVTTIGKFAFDLCVSLKSINVAKDNSHYCSENGVLFDITKKRLIQCPGGIKGNYAIPDGVTTIEEAAFFVCAGLTSVTIPNSVTTIGKLAFMECKGLTTVTIPNSVTKIGERAFLCCTGLTNVAIGNSITTIGTNAFLDCTGLTILTIENATPPEIYGQILSGVAKNITIYVPAESVEKYKTAKGWSVYADKIKAIEK